MKGRIILGLFALPFFCVGLWMLGSIGATMFDAWQMRAWIPVQAELSDAGFTSHTGGDSSTYEAYATYHYTVAGRRYTGSRVQLSSGGDNIGKYQQRTGSRLSASRTRGSLITVYVDPARPDQSIIDRHIRWGLLGFKSIFLLIFGGMGLGMLIYAFRTPSTKDATLPEYQAQPWLLRPDWHAADVSL